MRSSGPGLRRVPDLVLVGIVADAPPQDDRLEPRFLMYSLRSVAHSMMRISTRTPMLAQRGLDDLGDLLALVVALVGEQLEGERLAVLDQDPVGVALRPAGLGQERRAPARVVGIRAHVRVVGPGARLEGAGGLAPQAEDDAVDQLPLVDGVGERLADPPVGEARIPQIEAEVRVAVGRVLELVVGLAEGRVVGLPLELQRGEAARPSDRPWPSARGRWSPGWG